MIWSSLWPFVLFVVGIVVVIWATDRLLEGLIGLAGLLRVSTFAIAAILSGFEAENVAVGLVAARREAAELALGTVFGGAVFLICVALGLGALLYPLRVTLPRGFLILMAFCPVLVGVGLVVIAVGGELVTRGAEGIVSVLGLSTLLVGMVVTPAAIEIEEVIRQAVPAREGRPEVSAGNLVGTLLYFLWFNMGLISLFLPVRADPLVVRLDWPYLVGVTWLATLFFARGRVGRPEGALLVVLYAVYVALHIAFG